MKRVLFGALLALAAAGFVFADTVTFRDGKTVRGTFLGGTARQIRVEVRGEIQTYDIGDVRGLTFSDDAVSAPPPPAPPPQAMIQTYPPQPAPRPNPAAYADGSVIPAGAPITVRMVDAVNSETSRTGQTYMASLDEPIVVDGRTLLSRGADVITKLVSDQQAGRLQGRTVLTLALVSIKVNDRWVELSSEDVRTESASQGAKSGKVVGGTAALGAIIGGIVGGGKGAAIGAGSGAVVGAGAAVMTSGEKVVIPSETRLTFHLQTPAQL